MNQTTNQPTSRLAMYCCYQKLSVDGDVRERLNYVYPSFLFVLNCLFVVLRCFDSLFEFQLHFWSQNSVFAGLTGYEILITGKQSGCYGANSKTRNVKREEVEREVKKETFISILGSTAFDTDRQIDSSIHTSICMYVCTNDIYRQRGGRERE